MAISAQYFKHLALPLASFSAFGAAAGNTFLSAARNTAGYFLRRPDDIAFLNLNQWVAGAAFFLFHVFVGKTLKAGDMATTRFSLFDILWPSQSSRLLPTPLFTFLLFAF